MNEGRTERCEPAQTPEMPPNAMTRTRYLELAEIAKTLCDQLEKMQVKRSEGCIVKEMCDRLWNL